MTNSEKKVIIFAFRVTPIRDETTAEVININFTSEHQKIIRFFYLRGGFDFSKLGIIDKVLMMLLKFKIRMKRKSKRSPDEKGMLEVYNKLSDFSKRKYIEELVNFAKTQN